MWEVVCCFEIVNRLDFRSMELGCNLQDDNFLWIQISKLQGFCNYFFRIVVFILQQVIREYIIDL